MRRIHVPMSRHARHDIHTPDSRRRVTNVMFVSPPAGAKLEESARPTPVPSPAEPSDDAAMQPPDDRPKLDVRRKSTSWKTFNLKRQLSKVDLRLKAAFTVPPAENELDEDAGEKGNSQFYCDSSLKPEMAQEAIPDPPTTVSTEEDESKPEIEEVEEEAEKSTDKSPLSSPLRVCSDVFERMHKELQEKRSVDVYDRMHKELQERWQDKERAEAESDAGSVAAPPERPDNLPLFEEDGRPVRPPRQKGRRRDERDQREQRLLSVPNIKYKSEVRDLRRKYSAAPAPTQAQPSFAGSLMRRFSKYPRGLLTTSHLTSPH